MFRFARHDTGRPPSLALLAAVTAIGFCALHVIVPALPLLARVFGESPAEVQLTLTLYLIGIAGGQLFYGPISDRFGRRPVLIGGLAMFLTGTLLCGVAWSLPVLIAGRVLEAGGGCAGIVLGRAIIRDVYAREAAARGIALVMMTMTFASAVSPAIGAYLAEWVDWRAIFGVLGVFGAAVLVVVMMRLDETNIAPTRLDLVGMVRSYVTLLRTPAFVGFAGGSACASAAWFTFCASAPHVLVEALGKPVDTYGLMILLPMATYALGNAGAASLTMRLGSLRLAIFGRALGFVSAVIMVAWYLTIGLDMWGLFLPIALCAIGDGLSQPSVLAAGLSIRPQLAGTASGLIGFLQMTVAAAGTFVVALLPYDIGAGMIAVVAIFLTLALGLVVFALGRSSGASHSNAPVLGLKGEESA